MAQRSHVPKFGNWEGEDNVPYTVYFEKARKGRGGGKMINPNDPQDNPEAFSDDASSSRAIPSRTGVEPETQAEHGAVRPKHEHRTSREDGDFKQPTNSPLRHDTVGRRASTDLPPQQLGDRVVGLGEAPKRTGRSSGGFERSVEHSPLHPHYQAKVAGKGSGVSSPSWERKGSSEASHGFAPLTPGRTRLRSAGRGDETPEKGAAVPKFGEWDENDPSSADGYTHIFNKVREEKHSGTAPVNQANIVSPYFNGQKQKNYSADSVKCGCFSWAKK